MSVILKGKLVSVGDLETHETEGVTIDVHVDINSKTYTVEITATREEVKHLAPLLYDEVEIEISAPTPQRIEAPVLSDSE